MATHFFRRTLAAGLSGLLLLAGPVLRAQAPTWTQANLVGTSTSTTQRTGTATIGGMATDAAGNLFVVGNFTGQVHLGGWVLNSAGSNDIFLAKYVPATGQWAWVEQAGGTEADAAGSVTVVGNTIYVAGSITNTLSDAQRVRFGTNAVQLGAASNQSSDLFVAKYTDNGTGASLNWTQVGGGTGYDGAHALAVVGNNVYVAGSFQNNRTDQYTVRFGGSGSTPGTLLQYGANNSSIGNNDWLLVKYTDNGSSATVSWTQAGGGSGDDNAASLAVNGTSLYLAGAIGNNAADVNGVTFGGSGTAPGTVRHYGASPLSNLDAAVVKYTDQGTSAVVNWTLSGGGTDNDQATSVAVNGANVYLTGYIINTLQDAKQVRFGNSGSGPGTVVQLGASPDAIPDLFLNKYTDNGSSATLGWTQVAGGRGIEAGHVLAVDGSSIYLTGVFMNNNTDNNSVRFGGSGTTPGTIVRPGLTYSSEADWLLAKYTDNGSSASVNWTQVGGGIGDDRSMTMTRQNGRTFVAGYITYPGTFGAISLAFQPSGFSYNPVLALINEGAPLATVPLLRAESLQLYPTVLGPDQLLHYTDAPAAGGVLEVTSVLGQRLRRYPLPAGTRGQIGLGGLPAGCYLVRLADQSGPVQRIFIGQ